MKQVRSVLYTTLLLALATGCSADSTGGDVEFSESSDPVSNSKTITGTIRTFNPENTSLGQLALKCTLPKKVLSLTLTSFAGTPAADGTYPAARLLSVEQRWGTITDDQLVLHNERFMSSAFVNELTVDLTGAFTNVIALQSDLESKIAVYNTAIPLIEKGLRLQPEIDSLYYSLQTQGYYNPQNPPPSPEVVALKQRVDSLVEERDRIDKDAIREVWGGLFDGDRKEDYENVLSSRASLQEKLANARKVWGELSANVDPNSLIEKFGPDWAFGYAADGAGRNSMTMNVGAMQKVISACTR